MVLETPKYMIFVGMILSEGLLEYCNLPFLSTYPISAPKTTYTETSMVPTLMARLLRLFRTRYWVPRNIFHNCRYLYIWDYSRS